jgi:hypothetical protein
LKQHLQSQFPGFAACAHKKAISRQLSALSFQEPLFRLAGSVYRKCANKSVELGNTLQRQEEYGSSQRLRFFCEAFLEGVFLLTAER